MKMIFKKVSRELVIERTDAMKPFSGRKGIIDNSKRLLDIMLPFLDPEKIKKHSFKRGDRLGSLPVKMNNLLQASVDPILNWSFNDSHEELVINIRCMHGIYDHQHYMMPLYWLPKMYHRNRKLHNLIVETLQYTQDRTQVWCLDEDSGGWPYEIVSEGKIYLKDDRTQKSSKEDDLIIQKKDEQLNLFDKHFERYYKLLNQPGPDVTKLKRKLKTYPESIGFDGWLIEWCLDLVDCAENCKCNFTDLYDNAFVKFCDDNEVDEDNMDCPPVSMRNWIMFSWFDDIDLIGSVEQYVEQSSGECGILEPYEDYPCRTTNEVKKAIDEFYSVYGDTPDRLAEIIGTGSSKIDMIEHYLKGNLITTMYYESYKRRTIRPSQDYQSIQAELPQ